MDIRNAIGADSIVSDDTFNDFFGSSQILPERHLLYAVLDRGVRDLITTEAGSNYRKDAIRWFDPPKTKLIHQKRLKYPFSFPSICLALDLTEPQLNYINRILEAAKNQPLVIRIEGEETDVLYRRGSRCFGRNSSTATIAEEFLLLQDARNGKGHS